MYESECTRVRVESECRESVYRVSAESVCREMHTERRVLLDPDTQQGAFVDEHKNDDDFSQISMCSFGYGASYFIYKLFGKRGPANEKNLPPNCSKVSCRSSPNRSPKVIAGGLGAASRL